MLAHKKTEPEIAYHNIINKTAQLVRELKITNSNEQFFVFTYLLWKDYFCLGRYEYIQIDYEDNLPNLGMQIMWGYGVCRHSSHLLVDVFNKLGQNAQELGVCYQPLINQPPRINHSVVLMKNQTTMVYDPTNRIIGEVNNNLIFHNYSNDDVIMFEPVIKDLYNINSEFIYNCEIISEQKQKILQLCLINERLIKQYHNGIITDIKKVIAK